VRLIFPPPDLNGEDEVQNKNESNRHIVRPLDLGLDEEKPGLCAVYMHKPRQT